MQKKNIIALLAIVFLLFSMLTLVFFSKPSSIAAGINFVQQHRLIAPLLLIVWRILGITFPALPAGIISFAFVPIFGWRLTYIYTLIGILIGTSIAFFLSRIFREKLVSRFMTLRKIHKLQSEMSKKKEFVAIVLLMLFSVPVMNFSSYIAGLTKVSYKKFILATFIASIPNIFIFYIGEETYRIVFGKSVFVGAIVLSASAFLVYLVQKYKIFRESKPFVYFPGFYRRVRAMF